jgi:hypothetical protein
MTPGFAVAGTAVLGFVATLAACEVLLAVAPRGTDFPAVMTRRVVLFLGRVVVVALIVVAGAGLLAAAPAPLTAGAVTGWLVAAVREFARERRLAGIASARPTASTSKEP